MGVKGVIVAAGYGTRFLPVTRCLPKEMLPLVDRPAIDFVVEEFVEAGIEEIIVISSRRKKVLEDWFGRDPELEAVFEREGATAKRAKLERPAARVAFVRQEEMLGAGHALLQVAPFLGDDAAVVAYPDDLFGQPNCSAQLIETWRATGSSVLCCHDLPDADHSRYGMLDVTSDGDGLRVRSLIEKPPVGQSPSSFVSLGRYLYTREFFDVLAEEWAGHEGGEYYPMAAINVLAERGRMRARIVEAERWDTGTPLGLLQAATEEAFRREHLGPAYRAWLRERLAEDA